MADAAVIRLDTLEGGDGSIALIAASRAGARLARRLGKAWPDSERYVLSRFLPEAGPDARAVSPPLSRAVGDLFGRCRGLVIFLPVGAVVRLIAPLLRDKFRDPGVVSADDGGRFAVCVLSGHAGGGNQLAERVASVLRAQAVVTSAAETRGLPPLELLGRPFGWKLEASRAALSRASAALVNDEPLGFYQDAGERLRLPAQSAIRRFRTLAALARSAPSAAIVVTDGLLPAQLAERSVVWRPGRLVAGLGCSSGASAEELGSLLQSALAAAGCAPGGLGLLATLDRKLAEPGLRELAAGLRLELVGYTSTELASQATPNPSETVQRAVGTPSVAEAAALLASGNGDLIVSKRASARATVALARRKAVPFRRAAPGSLG